MNAATQSVLSILAPFTLPCGCGVLRQFSTSASAWMSRRWRGVKFCSSADTPLEVVTKVQYWRTEPVWMVKPAVRIMVVSVEQSDNYTGHSLNYIKRNVPQSNIKRLNKSKVVTVTVFGKWKKYYTWRSARPPVRPPACPTDSSAQKTCSGQDLNHNTL